MSFIQTILDRSWKNLVAANRRESTNGWAAAGVFATGVGPEYLVGGATSVLYVGKSAGPLGDQVGSAHDQAHSADASREWMVGRRNLSAFWQMIDRIDPTRRTIAWTNISKMDRRGGQEPPKPREWQTIRDECVQALADEVDALRPRATIFATSEFAQSDVASTIARLGYVRREGAPEDGWSSLHKHKDGRVAITTKHPQGWRADFRDALVNFAKGQLG